MLTHTKRLQPTALAEAAAILRRGECVAFPTETVYGLGANALSAQAVAKIFQAKGRPGDNPLIIHCCTSGQAKALAGSWPTLAQRLAEVFWPGPLTMVVPRGDVPSIVTAGLDSVALRVPDHPLALALIQAAELPIAAPSANVSGKPSPTRAEHVLADLDGRIAAVLDGGETGWGLESTVVDCRWDKIRVLRPGGVSAEELRQVAPVENPRVEPVPNEAPRSPGMKYRHYAPKADVFLFPRESGQEIAQTVDRLQNEGKQVAVIASRKCLARLGPIVPSGLVFDMGSELPVIAHRIYHLLRQVDTAGADVVLVESVPEVGLGQAIMNRLRKAARGGRMVEP